MVCGRPCDHALQVPAVLSDLQRKVPQIPFIDRVLDSAILGWSSTCPCCANDRAWVRQRRKLWFRSCFSDMVVDVLCVPVVQILRCRCGGDSRLPQLQLLRNPSRFRTLQYFFVVDVPVVQVHLGVQSWTRSLTCPLLSTTGYCTVEVPQYSSSPTFVDIPVVQHRRG